MAHLFTDATFSTCSKEERFISPWNYPYLLVFLFLDLTYIPFFHVQQ
jgi:hypothetical protein